jgi:hypothetical protein
LAAVFVAATVVIRSVCRRENGSEVEADSRHAEVSVYGFGARCHWDSELERLEIVEAEIRRQL